MVDRYERGQSMQRQMEKRMNHSKASRLQCLWITCFLRAVWRQKNNKVLRGPTNSYKRQIDFSNVLRKRWFLLDKTFQHNKPCYLPRPMYSWGNNLYSYSSVGATCLQKTNTAVNHYVYYMSFVLWSCPIIWRSEMLETEEHPVKEQH